MPAVHRKTVRQLINEGAILDVQDGNHGELHPTQKDYASEGIPFIMASDLNGNDLDLITCKFLPEGLASTLRKGFALPGDVLLTHKGTLGLTTVVPALDTPYIMLTPQVTYYRVNPDALRPEYLHYVFSSSEFQKRLLCHVREGTRPYVGITAQLDLEIEYPDIEIQSAVVEQLGTLDRLIQLSVQSINRLEEAARLIYTEWFVRLRFPGHQSHAIKEGIPVGWSKIPLGDLAEVVMGQSPESKFFNDDGEGFPFHQGVTEFGDRFVTNKIFTTQANRFAHEGDILCSVRAPVGRLNLTREKIAIGRGLSAIRSKTGHQSLLLYQLKGLFVEEDMIGGGAIFASVGKKELFAQELLQPDPVTAAEFNRLVGKIDEQIETLTLQIAALKSARDLLLPRLISGQLRL